MLHSRIVELLENARSGAAKAINSIISSAYWEIGRRIVQEEQNGREKAGYSDRLIDRLSSDLMARFGRGFSRSNVFQMRQFYLAHNRIVQTVSGQSETPGIVRTPSGRLEQTPVFPLSWSHYVRLLTVRDGNARSFYESEALVAAGRFASWIDRSLHSSMNVRGTPGVRWS